MITFTIVINVKFIIIFFYGFKLLGPSWINKTEKAFFRGRDSREERLQLVQLSKENPELLDAGITGYFFFQEKEKELGKAKLIGFFDFFKVCIFVFLYGYEVVNLCYIYQIIWWADFSSLVSWHMLSYFLPS